MPTGLLLALLAACDTGRSRSGVTGSPPASLNATITGSLWCDLNCDGVRDASEPGMPAIPLTMVDDQQQTVTVMTNSAGDFLLSLSLTEGELYELRVDSSEMPDGTTPSPGTSTTRTIEMPLRGDGGGDPIFADVSFGFCPGATSGAIGDFVWHDRNRNGVQDPGEPGINRIGLMLRDAQGEVLARQATRSNSFGLPGYYRFEGLSPSSSYRVEVDPTTLPFGFAESICGAVPDGTIDSSCSPSDVDLLCVDLGVDFGFSAPRGQIGDFIWFDRDGDGQQPPDGGDGLNGVVVQLRDASGQLVRTTTTRTSSRPGFYRFTGLANGVYSVEIDRTSLPPGFELTLSNAADDVASDSNPSPSTVVLTAASESEPTVDFGFKSPFSASVGDRVWRDLDSDGLQDPGEPGLPGVVVRLRNPFGGIVASVTTDSQGRYRFPALPAGTYTIDVDGNTIPPGTTASPCEVGPDRDIDSNCSPAVVQLAAGQQELSIDFGFRSPFAGVIGDRVWVDTNCDGLQNGEAGLPGVRVVLRDQSQQVLAQQITNQNGDYEFAMLPTGTYRVEIDPTTLPAGFVATTCEVGSDPTLDSNCSPVQVALTAQTPADRTIDFGFQPPPQGVIGDWVWFDANGNGLQDPGETGFAGITVLLRNQSGAVLATTSSRSDGSYEFVDLCAGTYVVELDLSSVPLPKIPTFCLVGTDRSIDSNCTPATVVLPSSSSVDQTVDFGLRTGT